MRGRWDVGPLATSSQAAPSGPSSRGALSDSGSGIPPSAPVKYSHAYTLRDTNMRINGLCFSSDGSLLFLSSWDCSLHIHDVRRCVSIRSLHAHRHGIETIYLLPNSNHLCLCPTKLQGPPQQNKQDKQQQPLGGGGPGAPAGGGPSHAAPTQAAPAEGGGKAPRGECGGGSWTGPPSIAREGGNSYNLRLWDLRENRYVRVIPVSGRVVPGTGVAVHPKKGTFFCCTDDGFIKYYCSEKETYMWKRQTKTNRPLAAIEGEGAVGALYEGEGRVTLWDVSYLTEPFLSFNISPYLLQHQHQQEKRPLQQRLKQEIPTSMIFSPDGAYLIFGTDTGRLLAVNSFTGCAAAVWRPPAGAQGGFFSNKSHADRTGGSFAESFLRSAGPEEDFYSSSSTGTGSICAEWFIPAIDLHTETLLCGSTDGSVYGYDLKQAQRGAPSGASHPMGTPKGTSQAGILCPTCGGQVGRNQGEVSRDEGLHGGSSWGGSHLHECCCNILYKPGVTLGPHWAPPLWVAANPKHAVVATAGINCSIWKAEAG